MFGARCHATLAPEVTHVVAGKQGTAKVDEARRRGNIKVVTPMWFKDSVNMWQRQPESRYLLDPLPPSQGATPPDTDMEALGDAPESDDELLVTGDGAELELNDVDWADMDAEIAQELGDDDDLDDGEEDEEFSDETNSEITYVKPFACKYSRSRQSLSLLTGAPHHRPSGARSAHEA